MSYEYSSSSQNFTFPNPLREHNLFVAGAALIAGLTGFVLLFQARSALHTGQHLAALAAAAVAFLLVSVGGYLLFQLFSQLRFFFGRGRPQGLAPQLDPDQIGTSKVAETYIKESLRQQALEYPEPGDPLSSLLYYLVPDLIYAPRPVRAFAERQFQAGILTLALLAGLMVSAILGSGDGSGRVSGWVAIILFVISAPSLLNPKAGAREEIGINVLSVPKMAGLIAFSVLGPVAIALAGSVLPPPIFGIGATTLLLLLVLAGVLHALFFVAVVRHRMAAPSTTVSMIQDTWNISVNPALVSAEFMRAMQDAWWEKIPNRRYCRIDPVVNLQERSGQFNGSMVEETQPVPFTIDATGDGARGERPFASGNPAIITLINGYALLLVLVACVASYMLVGVLTGGGAGIGSLAACTVFVWALAKAAFDVARFLTLRFDFRSQVVWMDMNGAYAAAEVAQGNRYTSQIHSSSQVVQIEGMTFRLWMAEVHTVAFGKDGPRYIVSMMGKPDEAAALAKRLKDFITSQAVMVSVGSSGDQERAQRAGMMNAQLNLGSPPLPFDRIPPRED